MCTSIIFFLQNKKSKLIIIISFEIMKKLSIKNYKNKSFFLIFINFVSSFFYCG